MSHIAPLLPKNAPFSPAQRAWLNGFLAGLLGSAEAAAAVTAQPNPAPAPAEEFPWHDPALPLEERLALAQGRRRERVLMAAMAQLDCGQCGYLCQTYAEALSSGAEKSLSRCVPGGKETARALKELMEQPPTAPALPAAPASPPPAAASSTRAPTMARFGTARPLNGAGSEKDTRHVVFDIAGCGLDYSVGDSFGVQAENCPELVAAVEVLASRAPDVGESQRLQALAEGYPGAQPEDADLLDLLLAFPSARPPVQELISALSVLQPRLYSIASSPGAVAGELHLTVAAVRYRKHGRLRKGIASTFLA